MTDNFARLLALMGGNGGSGGTTNYEALTNKPSIGGVTLIGDLTLAELGIIVDDQLSTTSTNPVQNAVLTALLNAFPYSNVTGKPQINGVTLTGNITLGELGLNAIWVGTQAEYAVVESTLAEGTLVVITDAQDVDNVPTQSSTNLVYSGGVYAFVTQGLGNKVDKETGKGLSTEDYTTAEKTKLAGLTNDYTNHINKPQINSVTLSGNKTSFDLGLLPSSTKYGASISVTINDSTYVVTAILKDQDGNTLGTAQTIDLPLESMVVGGEYDDTTKKIILTLKNGQTVEFSVADLVAGLQTEITASNKLSADLVDDTNATNKFVSAAEKTSIGTSETKLAGVNSSASNYIELAYGKRLYLSDTEPTGAIPDGAIWIGGTVST